jgi:hypothetical protein
MTTDAVATETPASLATSVMVTLRCDIGHSRLRYKSGFDLRCHVCYTHHTTQRNVFPVQHKE